MTKGELIATWTRWDKAPSSNARANALVDATLAFCDQYHIRLVDITDAVQQGRREGRSYAEIINGLVP